LAHSTSRIAFLVAGVLAVGVLGWSCSGGSSSHKPAGNQSAAGSNTTSTTQGRISTSTTSGSGANPNAPESAVPGDIPDTQVFVAVTGPGYTIKVPQGWARTDTASGAVFSDHFNTERLDRATLPSAPTEASVRSSTVPQLQSSNAGFVLKAVTTVTRNAGKVVLTTYRANSAPDPVTARSVVLDVERYDFWRNGTDVTVTLSGPKGSDNVDPWKTVTNSFVWQ
jgi:hypothetical protein